MCKRLLVLLLVLGFVSSASAGLVHEWKFEDNLLDTSGSGNHGTKGGAGAPVYVPGQFGKALQYDGVDDMVTNLSCSNLPIADAEPYQEYSPDWSMNMWVWWDSIPGGFRTVGGFGMDASRAARYILSAGGNIYFYGYISDLNSGVAFDVGRWQMITVSFDKGPSYYGELKIYKDAVEIATSPSHLLYKTYQEVRTGFTGYVGYGYFPGKLDEFQIYDHTLSQAEIDALIPEPATIALLGFGGLALLRKRR